MSQFKVGDLAMIVSGPNTGCSVELLSFHIGGQVLLSSGMYSSVREPEWLVAGDGITARFGKSMARHPVKDGLIPSRFLMPLRGDFTPEQQKSQEVSA